MKFDNSSSWINKFIFRTILNNFNFFENNDDWLKTWYSDFLNFVIFKNIFFLNRKNLCLTSKIIVIRVWINLNEFMIFCRIRFFYFKKFWTSTFHSVVMSFNNDILNCTSYNTSNEEIFENAFVDVFKNNSTFTNKLSQNFSYCFINKQRNAIFTSWLNLFVWSFAKKWYVVIKFNFTSHLLNNFLQNFDVNFESRSNTIWWKFFQNLYTFSQYRSIQIVVEKLSIFDINLMYLKKRFVIIKNALFFLIIMNNFTTKFKFISKKDFWKIKISWSSLYNFWFEFFEIWENEHVVTYFVIFFRIFVIKTNFRKKS
jgi:hypothetical protein